MKVYHSLEEIGVLRNPVVTTGTFDGVHIGHLAIISRLRKLAHDMGGESVLITFHPHPRRVLYPETKGRDLMMICSQKEKVELLEKTGLDHLIIIEFTPEFSRITSHDFVEDILIGRLHARMVVVGFNHHFGHQRRGNFDYLYKLSRDHHFEVEEIPEQDIQNESVSSTRIRKAISRGNIQRANAYLDHYYCISGSTETHTEHSSAYGIPVFSLCIDDDTKLIPPDGVYAVSIHKGKLQVRGMLSVQDQGVTDNCLSPLTTVEFHPFGHADEFEKGSIAIFFHKKVRDAFPSKDPVLLKRQLEQDIRTVEELIF